MACSLYFRAPIVPNKLATKLNKPENNVRITRMRYVLLGSSDAKLHLYKSVEMNNDASEIPRMNKRKLAPIVIIFRAPMENTVFKSENQELYKLAEKIFFLNDTHFRISVDYKIEN